MKRTEQALEAHASHGKSVQPSLMPKETSLARARMKYQKPGVECTARRLQIRRRSEKKTNRRTRTIDALLGRPSIAATLRNKIGLLTKSLPKFLNFRSWVASSKTLGSWGLDSPA